MTAPLRSGDPITVNVALGAREYDIAIGRGLLASLGARIAEIRSGVQVAVRDELHDGLLVLPRVARRHPARRYDSKETRWKHLLHG